MVVVITKDRVEPRCMESILAQDYPDFQVMTLMTKAKKYIHPIMDKFYNCSDNRNQARKLALHSDADWFLFVDSDTVIPSITISRLILTKLDITGGWYKTVDGEKWVAAYRDSEGLYNYCEEPIQGISSLSMVGLGCCLISRRVLEKIEFSDGLESTINYKDFGTLSMGECFKFCQDAIQNGFSVYAQGDVICEHIVRENDGSSEKTLSEYVAENEIHGGKHGV